MCDSLSLNSRGKSTTSVWSSLASGYKIWKYGWKLYFKQLCLITVHVLQSVWIWAGFGWSLRQKGVSEQEPGRWQAACVWSCLANEKPLCPRWRLTLWFREAGSVSCLPCTFPIRGLCQASAEQSSPCDWRGGREREGVKGKTGEEGGGSFKSREFQFWRVTSGSYIMQVLPFFFLLCLPHPRLWCRLWEAWQ